MSQPPDTSPTPHPLLDVRRLCVRFGHKQVVQEVDLRIGFGEKVALVGESGSGKTVTALSLLRLLTHAEVQGQALFAARADASPADLLQLPERQLRAVRGGEIAMIFQEPMTALNPLMTIGAQIAEVLLLKRGMNKTQALTEAIALLERTGLPEPARRAQAYPHQLSGGQRQRAMIAMALAGEPALLLADEPTTALDVTIRGQILDLLDDLQQQNGMAVLMITHDLLMVQRFARRIIVMENGRVVEQGLVGEVFANPQHPYTRKLLASMPERNVVEHPDVAPEAVAAIHAQNLCISYPVSAAGVKGWFRKDDFVAVRDASLQLRPAHTLGVVGESGSGKSTLAQAILGLLPFGGELRINGQHWQCSKRGALANTPHNKALRREIQVVFQDPFSSLSPRMTVEEIVEEGLRVHEPALDAAARRQRVLDVLGEVGLGEAQFPGLLSRYPHEFSGGQRQRLAVARALILHPRVLVLDEPTSALDVTIQKQVLSLLQRLQKEMGLAYLLITHDVDVIRAMAHDVLVMKDSRIVESGPVRQVLDNPQMAYTRELVSAAGLRTND